MLPACRHLSMSGFQEGKRIPLGAGINYMAQLVSAQPSVRVREVRV